MKGTNVEYDKGDGGATREAQQQKCGNTNKEKEKANIIGDDDNDVSNGHVEYNRLITKMDDRLFDEVDNEEQAQQVHVIQDNNDNKVIPKAANTHDTYYMTHVIRTHPGNTVAQPKKHQHNKNNKNTQDSNDNKVTPNVANTQENKNKNETTENNVEYNRGDSCNQQYGKIEEKVMYKE